MEQINKKIYIPGFCHADKSKPKQAQHICMQVAGYKLLMRADSGNRPNSQPIYTWLCEKHVKSAIKAGYIVAPAVYYGNLPK